MLYLIVETGKLREDITIHTLVWCEWKINEWSLRTCIVKTIWTNIWEIIICLSSMDSRNHLEIISQRGKVSKKKTGQELRDRSILRQEQVVRMTNRQKQSPFGISFVSTPNPLDHTLLKPIFRHTHQYFRELTLTEDFLAKDSRGIIRVTREIYVWYHTNGVLEIESRNIRENLASSGFIRYPIIGDFPDFQII